MREAVEWEGQRRLLVLGNEPLPSGFVENAAEESGEWYLESREMERAHYSLNEDFVPPGLAPFSRPLNARRTPASLVSPQQTRYLGLAYIVVLSQPPLSPLDEFLFTSETPTLEGIRSLQRWHVLSRWASTDTASGFFFTRIL